MIMTHVGFIVNPYINYHRQSNILQSFEKYGRVLGK